MRYTRYVILFLVVCILLLAGCTGAGRGAGQGAGQGSGQGDGMQMQVHEEHVSVLDMPVEDVSEAEVEALAAALDDERKALATYDAVIAKFGEVRPFSNIRKAEQTHIDSLLELYGKYGIEIPEDAWTGNGPEFDSVQAACDAGVQAEIDNAALYDELFAKVDNEDIIFVFTALRDASENNHLPAFERCGGAK